MITRVSSVGGRRVMGGSLYSATKHAVTAIGLGLRAELRQQHGNQEEAHRFTVTRVS